MAPLRFHFFWLVLALLTLYSPAYALEPAALSSIAQKHLATKTAAPGSSTGLASLQESLNKHHNTSASTIAEARAKVAEAIRQVSISNKARVEHPLRNSYGTQSPASRVRRDAPPPLVIASDVAAAAALVAEVDAAAKALNGTLYSSYPAIDAFRQKNPELKKQKRQTTSFWLEDIDHLGTQPFGNDPSYKVFRNVKTDYKAKGDGVTDDTAAINAAISDGTRCGAGCNSSTVKGALVYFPAGTYLVSGSLITYYNTQLVGNPNHVPTIKASANFVGLGVIDTDYYIPGGNGAEWYINQANFYRQIRNFNIDITATTAYAVCGIHYQVAQATSLYNIGFIQSQSPTTTQQGIFTENGSGGFMNSLIFLNGAFGIYGGNQQFTATNMEFAGCHTAIQLIWDWGWIWQGLTIASGTVGISLLGQDGVTRGTGSLLVQDTTFKNVATAILMAPPIAGAAQGSTGITLDNVAFSGVTSAIADSGGKTWLAGSVGSVDTFTLGDAYFSSPNSTFTFGTTFKTPRNPSLTSTGAGLPKAPYYLNPKNQYTTFTSTNIIQMKWFTPGDGVTDATKIFQDVITAFSFKEYIIYINAGSYILSDTITIPSGAQIVGECWAQLIASGAKFQDMTNPLPLIQVGASGGETGTVEIQDLLFTTIGATQGLIAVEWNMNAATQGSAAMWDCHVRIGGAIGSNLQVAQCPARTNSVNDNCIAGSLMMHITPSASGYFENVWLWTADHDIDNLLNTQVSVYVARGMLVESVRPVWLYGTASEHSTFYQYQFYQASNLLAAMIQTETPYYQPSPLPPAPFLSAIGAFTSDPQDQYCTAGSDGCDAAWAVRIIESSNMTIAGAGLYSFFQDYDETCVNTQNCQLAMVQIENTAGNVNIYNLVTLGAVSMVDALSYQTTEQILAIPNTDAIAYPWWSVVTVLQPVAVNDGSSSTNSSDVVYIDPSIWSSTAPVIQCEPPCTLILPPYTLTSKTTITWPVLTTTLLSSSKGSTYTTTTTIKIPKVTTSLINFWPITVYPGDPPSATFAPVQSVMPPSTVITLSGTIATLTPTQFPTGGNPTPTSTTTSSGILPPVFFSSKHTVTIQPQPTISIQVPPPTIPSVTYSSGKPSPTCKKGCGYYNCDFFGCGFGCGIFACDSGCGIFGCGSGCGLFGCGCGVGCPLTQCGGPGCLADNCGYGENGDGNPSSTPCTTTTTSGCDTICYASPTSCTTTCSTKAQCEVSVTGTQYAVTGAPFAIWTYNDVWPTTAVAQSVVNMLSTSGVSLLVSLYGINATVIPISLTTMPTQTSTTPTHTASQTPVTPSATCTAIANIANTQVTIWTNYVTDGGTGLEVDEMDYCPLLSGWTASKNAVSFTGANGVKWVSNQMFQFTLEITHPAVLHCVSKAIILAGGPADTPDCAFIPAIQPPKKRSAVYRQD